MRVAILAQFPVHLLPGFESLGEPKQHYATWLPQLAESFARAEGFEFHWVTLTTETAGPLSVRHLGQTFHILPTATSRRASTLFRKDRAAIGSVLDTIRPDLVHGWGTEDAYALAAVTSGFPNVVSMAGLLSYYVLKARMHPRDVFQALIELFVLRAAQHITVETEWGRKVLRRRTSRPISLVEYGVRPHFYDIGWKPDPAKPAALFVGSITPRKGIQDAVAAFRDSRLAQCRLRVAGAGGAWAAKLKTAAPPNTDWLGQITPAAVAAELAQAWCLVLPTRCDTSPNVVKEARVIGLPVITTPEGGQADYIRDGENGFLVPPAAISLLADRLAEALGSAARCQALGRSAHEEARRHFLPTNTAEGFLGVYRPVGETGAARSARAAT